MSSNWTVAISSGEIRGTVQSSAISARSRGYGAARTEIEGDAVSYPATDSRSAEKLPSKLRTKELIAEIDAINAQIHRMMFQVEKAVARLALG